MRLVSSETSICPFKQCFFLFCCFFFCLKVVGRYFGVLCRCMTLGSQCHPFWLFSIYVVILLQFLSCSLLSLHILCLVQFLAHVSGSPLLLIFVCFQKLVGVGFLLVLLINLTLPKQQTCLLYKPSFQVGLILTLGHSRVCLVVVQQSSFYLVLVICMLFLCRQFFFFPYKRKLKRTCFVTFPLPLSLV